MEDTQAEMPVEDAPVVPTDTDSSPVAEVETVETTPPANTRPRDEESGQFLSANAQKRIDELTRNWREEQRRNEWLQQQVQRPPEPPKVEAPARLPSLEEHGYDEGKYQAALLEYADKRAEAVVERRLQEADQKRAEQKRTESFAERQASFAKANPDYVDKVLRDEFLPISLPMREVILDSDHGPELALWLANNREQADQISRLPAHLAAVQLGRIEGKLEAQKEAATRPAPAPAVSHAPPPPPKVSDETFSIGNVKASDPESDKLSMDDWWKRRTKETTRKR